MMRWLGQAQRHDCTPRLAATVVASGEAFGWAASWVQLLQLGGLHPCAHGRAWVPQLEGGSYTQRAGGSYGGRGGRVAAARARTRYSWSGRWGSEILNFADTSILHVPRHGGRKPHTAGGSYKPCGIFILNGLADATWQGD